jgi:hypothetical protein
VPQQPVIEAADLDDGEVPRRRRGPPVEVVQELPDFVSLRADLSAEDNLPLVVAHMHGQLLAMLVNSHVQHEEVLLDHWKRLIWAIPRGYAVL